MRLDDDFLAAGGAMGALMRAKDWAATPLGPASGWPQSLRTAVSILLNSRHPMFLFWGPRLIKIYNDGYRPILGDKHPGALGCPGPEVWPEIWSDIGPMVDRVVQDGEATWSEDLRLFMHRRGFPEEVFFTFSYSPIRDESGGIGGMFCACTETSRKVLGERRLQLLRDLAASSTEARSVEDVRIRLVEVLRANSEDIPCAEIDLGNRGDWPVGIHSIAALGGRFPVVPCGPWPEPPAFALIQPLAGRAAEGATAMLVLGISARLAFDESYRSFFELVAGQVTSSLAYARASEEERRRAEALAELDRAKTTFFSNVSHEFRTPLTLLLGPVADGLADREHALPDAQRERFEIVRRSGLRLQRLVNTLLDFSRIEVRRTQANYFAVDLAALTADLASSFRSAIERAGLAFRVDCPPLPEPAWVDPEMWEKIVLNLVSNALKFTFEGEIVVALRAVDDRFELVVRDTGTGIAAAERARVFERFHRIEGARSRTHEGTGIGLALVRELALLHGGGATVDSVEGEGSTFVVSIRRGCEHLPVDRVHAAAPPGMGVLLADPFLEEAESWLPQGREESSAFAPASGSPRPRILWVDDNADMRLYVSRLLSVKYDVEVACDGEEALAAARARPPDLVLADVMMPRLDGLGLVRALRADARSRAVPVILLSARVGEESRIEGMGAGADDYLQKPFSARELLARIASRLELGELQARLAQERTGLADLFAQTPVPTAVLRGPQLVVEMANPGYLAVTGHRGIIGQPLFTAVPELAGQGLEEILREVRRSGEPYVGNEHRLRLDRGGRLEDTWWTFIYAPLRDTLGATDGVIAICHEVTEAVRARETVARSEERYRSIFDSAAVSIWEEDFSAVAAELDRLKAAGVDDLARHFRDNPEVVRDLIARVRIVGVNAATLRMFGARDEAELTASLGRIFLPESEAVFALELLALADGQPTFESDMTLRTLGGENVEVLLRMNLPPRGGGFDQVLVTLMDITARKRAERALRESEAKFRTLADAAPAFIWFTDAQGEPRYVNSRYTQLVGRSAEIEQGAWHPLLHPEDREAYVIEFGRAVRERGEFRARARIQGAGGGWKWIESYALPLHDDHGSFVGHVGISPDVSDAVALEVALRETDRMKDEFLATLSHELRNPLAPLRNALHLLRRSDGTGPSPAVIHEMMERQVNHLVRLVDDLLETARITSGALELRRERIDAGTVVRNALETSSPHVDGAGHALVVELPEEPLWLFGDPVRLAQIVSNLINNAAKYTAPGGRIVVHAKQSAGEATIAVRDNGPGIAPEAIGHVFEMFQRGENRSVREKDGLGIGLALSRRLAQMHGGTIEAFSQGIGRGSTFTLRLPLEGGAERKTPLGVVTESTTVAI